MFDAIAPRYDLLNHLLSAGFDRRWRARASAALAFTGRETLLDVCTGTADLAIAAVSRAGRGAARAIGVDFAAQMLARGRAKLVRAGLGDRIRLVQADAERVPLSECAVDGVTIGFGIRNAHSPAAVCAEVLRVLRPGGRLVVLEFGAPDAPVLRAAYLWYFRRILPRIGRLISKHETAYAYLPASVGTFYTPAAFSALLTETGFSAVRAVPLTFGIVYMYVAQKPRSETSRAALRERADMRLV